MEKNDLEIKAISEDKNHSLVKIWDAMQELGITDVRYTVLTIKDIAARHANVEEALSRRQISYGVELNRQTEVSCEFVC